MLHNRVQEGELGGELEVELVTMTRRQRILAVIGVINKLSDNSRLFGIEDMEGNHRQLRDDQLLARKAPPGSIFDHINQALKSLGIATGGTTIGDAMDGLGCGDMSAPEKLRAAHEIGCECRGKYALPYEVIKSLFDLYDRSPLTP